MKIIKALLGSAIFLFAVVVVYYIHINYFRVDVVFYAAIFDGFLAAIIAGLIVLKLQIFRVLGGFEKFLLIVIWLITGYALAISVPTVIDRSLSFYILEKIQQRGGGIRYDGFEQVFTREYVKEHHLVDVRLTEQLKSGTVVIEDGCVLLTPKGEMVAGLSRSFRQQWLPKQRLLLGEYSDVLLDPFKGSDLIQQYTCRKR